MRTVSCKCSLRRVAFIISGLIVIRVRRPSAADAARLVSCDSLGSRGTMKSSFLARVGLFAFAVAMAQPGAAADLAVEALPVMAPPTWSGLYFGGTFGGALSR